jgi:hypothetical protein
MGNNRDIAAPVPVTQALLVNTIALPEFFQIIATEIIRNSMTIYIIRSDRASPKKNGKKAVRGSNFLVDDFSQFAQKVRSNPPALVNVDGYSNPDYRSEYSFVVNLKLAIDLIAKFCAGIRCAVMQNLSIELANGLRVLQRSDQLQAVIL